MHLDSEIERMLSLYSYSYSISPSVLGTYR